MEQRQEDESKLRSYLLGELSREERVLVEARLFLDGEYLSQLDAVEEELIDEYVYYELPAHEREKLASQALSKPELHEDLELAQALKKRAPPVPWRLFAFLKELFTKKPAVGFALATAALIVLSLVVWFAVGAPGRPWRDGPVARGPEPSPTARPDEPPPEERPKGPGTQPGRQPPAGVVAFTLLPGGVARGGGKDGNVTFGPEVDTVELTLPLTAAGDYQALGARLETGGRAIHTWQNLESGVDAELGPVVTLTLPAKLLRPRSYLIRLSGLTAGGQTRDLTSYTFRVEKQQTPAARLSPPDRKSVRKSPRQ